MKTKVFFTVIASALLFLISAGDLSAASAPGKPKKDQQQVVIIRGRVTDAETNLPLVFAGIAVQGSNVSTVTNLDGEFTLKISGDETGKIEFSYVGYKNRVMAIDEMKTNGQRNVIETGDRD
ncbi:MAG: carboxypeptidase-like regulatory domain-containing protein [Marinilabiliales bacterium]|nr:carboxypeptidase-like regulatory domain-containing protein [Marinilabiliales bacterium]